MNKLIKVSSLLAICMLTISFGLYANPDAAGQYGRDQGHKEMLSHKLMKKAQFLLLYQDELGLSEDQIKQIREIKVNAKKSKTLQGAEIKVIKMDIDQLMYAHQIDTDAVNKLIDEKYKIKVAKEKTLVEHYAQLKSVLSEDQYKTMKDIWRSKKKDSHRGKH